MLNFNGVKFASSDEELINGLFSSGGTASGYYRVNRKTITLLDLQRHKIGVVTSNHVLARADKIKGAWWYSYGDIEIIGEYISTMEQAEDIARALDLL